MWAYLINSSDPIFGGSEWKRSEWRRHQAQVEFCPISVTAIVCVSWWCVPCISIKYTDCDRVKNTTVGDNSWREQLTRTSSKRHYTVTKEGIQTPANLRTQRNIFIWPPQIYRSTTGLSPKLRFLIGTFLSPIYCNSIHFWSVSPRGQKHLHFVEQKFTCRYAFARPSQLNCLTKTFNDVWTHENVKQHHPPHFLYTDITTTLTCWMFSLK